MTLDWSGRRDVLPELLVSGVRQSGRTETERRGEERRAGEEGRRRHRRRAQTGSAHIVTPAIWQWKARGHHTAPQRGLETQGTATAAQVAARPHRQVRGRAGAGPNESSLVRNTNVKKSDNATGKQRKITRGTTSHRLNIGNQSRWAREALDCNTFKRSVDNLTTTNGQSLYTPSHSHAADRQ